MVPNINPKMNVKNNREINLNNEFLNIDRGVIINPDTFIYFS